MSVGLKKAENSMTTKTYRACPALREAIKFSLVLQVLILILAGLAADGGGMAQICFFAFVAFNSYVGSVLLFRRMSPTKLDLVLIRAGYLPTIVATGLLARYIWDLRGF